MQTSLGYGRLIFRPFAGKSEYEKELAIIGKIR